MQDANSAVLATEAVKSDLDASTQQRPAAPLYTKDEVIAHFEGLFTSIDLKEEIAALGGGLNSLFKKGRSLTEFTAMTMVLWKLALDSSFPQESEEFFQDFIACSPILGKGKKREQLISCINMYRNLFSEKKTDDFTPVSHHIIETLCKDSSDKKALQLKVSLAMRKLYQIIFEHLI